MLPPPLLFRGRDLPAECLAGWASAWLEEMPAQASGRPQALPMANHPESVALLHALLARPDPVVPLPLDPREWPALLTACPGMQLQIPPVHAGLAVAGEAAGLEVARLSPRRAANPQPLEWRAPALVSFTSGSTGPRRCISRDPRAMLASSAAIGAHLGLAPGAGVLGFLPLSGPHGLVNSLLLALSLGSELGLLESFEPRAALALFATGRFAFWAGTPILADLLSRTPLPGPVPPSPAVVKLSGGRLPEGVFRAYRARFGVPPRPAFGTTEHGVLTADGAAPEEVRADAVGQPLRGVELRIGAAPGQPLRPGEVGPVWARSPWPMLGYGWPPAESEHAEGWRPTGDLGCLDSAATLRLAGRVDDCFKTPAGHLIQPAVVAQAITAIAKVADAVVVPLAASLGGVVGAVVEGSATDQDVRRHLAGALPAWSQPQVIVLTPSLPRLADGKPDRQACLRLLEESR